MFEAQRKKERKGVMFKTLALASGGRDLCDSVGFFHFALLHKK
jgi:hypothetical protein